MKYMSVVLLCFWLSACSSDDAVVPQEPDPESQALMPDPGLLPDSTDSFRFGLDGEVIVPPFGNGVDGNWYCASTNIINNRGDIVVDWESGYWQLNFRSDRTVVLKDLSNTVSSWWYDGDSVVIGWPDIGVTSRYSVGGESRSIMTDDASFCHRASNFEFAPFGPIDQYPQLDFATHYSAIDRESSVDNSTLPNVSIAYENTNTSTEEIDSRYPHLCGQADLDIPVDLIPDSYFIKGKTEVFYHKETGNFYLDVFGYFEDFSVYAEVSILDSNGNLNLLTGLSSNLYPDNIQPNFRYLTVSEQTHLTKEQLTLWRQGKFRLTIYSEVFPEGKIAQIIRNPVDCDYYR